MNQRARWKVLPPAPDEYLNISDIPSVVAQLLYNRDIQIPEIESFISAGSKLTGDPFLLPDMSLAVSRIYKALLSKEKIAAFGDFDVDGVTATTIIVEGLSWLGADIISYIPDRSNEGHGLNSSAIEKLYTSEVNLIITVDCGVTDLAEAKQAREMGMDMIITDHHIPAESLPRAIAVIDPKRKDSVYPYPELAGAGVAFKLIQALFHKDSREKRLERLLDLVALATITDLVPLVGENRYLVKEGMKELNNTQRIGLQEMVKSAGLKLGGLDAKDVSWTLGPRLNAAGRMDNASVSYQLLNTRSVKEARLLAMDLGEKNAQRQRTTKEILSKAKEKLAGKMHLPLLIDGDEDYPVGVIGLVAGKLVDEFCKPAVIISLGPEICRGSTRSIPQFNMVTALKRCQDLLDAFGGHPMAAGFSVTPYNLPRLEERLVAIAMEELSCLDLRPELVIDAELPLSAFAGDVFSSIQELSPFGRGNPLPVFLTRRVDVAECRNFGSHSEWLRLKLKQENVTWRAVDFGSKKAAEDVPSCIDIVYSLEKSWWNGEGVLSLNLRDFAPSD